MRVKSSSTLTSFLWLFFALPTVRLECSSLSDQLEYVDEERKLIDNLRHYVEAENTRLDKLKKFVDRLAVNIESFAVNEDEVAWNPLVVYRIVKDLTADFDDTKKTMTKNSYDDNVGKMLNETDIVLPSKEHLYGEIRSLVHLQRAYDFTVADIMNGRLAQDLEIGNTLTYKDCFCIGEMSAERLDYETAVDWLRQCDYGSDEETRKRASDVLIQSTLFTGDKELCRIVVNGHSPQGQIVRKYTDLAIKLGLELGSWTTDLEADQWESFRICAGDYEDEVRNQNLKCRYNHHNSPFLTIAPLKEEILSFVPKISLFREVVYDSEIELLKTDAYNVFQTAMVFNDNGEGGVDLSYRPSQTAGLDNKDPKYSSLYRRLEDVSSLSQRYSENFQMLHYAPGGFYRVHGDYFESETDLQQGGNRIATALMYLNDVTLGGSTVFPRRKLGVRPTKGSILFWINMRVDRSEETLTRHAACPVIYGEKIACTQWLRMDGQDHWIGEPRDEMNNSDLYRVNPNLVCMGL